MDNQINLTPNKETQTPETTTPNAVQPETVAPQPVQATPEVVQPTIEQTQPAQQPTLVLNSEEGQAPQPEVITETPAPEAQPVTEQPTLVLSSQETTTPAPQPVETLTGLSEPTETLGLENVAEPTIINDLKEDPKSVKQEQPQQQDKPKKKTNGLLIVLLLLVLLGAGAYVYLTYFHEPNTSSTAPQGNSKLIEIKTAMENSEYYQELTKEVDILPVVENDNLTLTINYEDYEGENQTTSCLYTLTDDNLTITMNDENSFACSVYSMLVFDAVGVTKGIAENKVLQLMSLGNDYAPFITVDEDDLTITMNIAAEIDTTMVDSEYFTPELILAGNEKEYYTEIETSSSVSTSNEKEKITLVISANSEEITIYFAEDNEATDITYNSILSSIEALYPEDLDKFKQNFIDSSSNIYENYRIIDNVSNGIKTQLQEDWDIDIDKQHITMLIITKETTDQETE